MSNRVSLIKKISLYVLFVVFVVLLFNTTAKFAESRQYFSIAKPFSVYLIVYLFLSVCVLSIISETFDKKREIVFLPAILYIISFVFLSKYKVQEALLVSSIICLVFLYGVRRTYYLRENLLVLKIRHSARTSVTMFFFSVGLFAAFSTLLVSEHVNSIDVGQRVADITEKPIKNVVMMSYEDQLKRNVDEVGQNTTGASSSQLMTVLKSLGVTNMISSLTTPEDKKSIQESAGNGLSASIKNVIAEKTNSFLLPYRKFFSPTLAVLVFGIFQIYAWIAYVLYSQFIGLLLVILKKTGFVKIEKVPAEREILKF